MISEIRILALTFLLFLNAVQIGFSQKKISDFFDLSIHEKIWVFGHPFIARKAYKLGIAHERKNKTDFKKGRYEDGSIPDAIESKMDLLNNRIGIDIGISNPNLHSRGLKYLIINEIIEGELWIIKSDKGGKYLDKYDNVLNVSNYVGVWENDKYLVKSNFPK